jgi:RND superfamily putative drug exporter
MSSARRLTGAAGRWSAGQPWTVIAAWLDATVVRALLLPAVMKLLGPRNWYLPRWLGWLPRVSAPPPSGPPPSGPPPARKPPVTTAGH